MAYWYRYTDPISDEGVPYLSRFRVVRHTPKGVWIELWPGGEEKFVLASARKRFAYPTIELARESYRKRKEWQIKHLTRQLDKARRCLAADFDDTRYRLLRELY